MTWLRRAFLLGLVVSVLLHLTAVAMTLNPKPETEVEGSGEIQSAVLGTSPFNTVMAGSVAETANAEPVHAERVEAQKVTETRKANAPEALTPSEYPKPNPIQPSSPAQSVTPIAQKPVQPTLKLNTSVRKSLALERKAEQAQRKVLVNGVPPNPAEPVVSTVSAETQNLTKRNPEVPPTATKATTIKEESIEQVTAETTKPVAPEQEQNEAANNIPPPPVKPKFRPQHVAEKASKSEPKKKQKAQSKKRSKGEASRTSRSGAGGKSNSTAQKGGSERKGKGKTAGNSNATNYPAKVHRKLLRSMRSPSNRGRVLRDAIVRFTVHKNGSVTGISLARSSGSKAVDRAAVKAVQRAAPFPPIPDVARKKSWAFSLPVGQ